MTTMMMMTMGCPSSRPPRDPDEAAGDTEEEDGGDEEDEEEEDEGDIDLGDIGDVEDDDEGDEERAGPFHFPWYRWLVGYGHWDLPEGTAKTLAQERHPVLRRIRRRYLVQQRRRFRLAPYAPGLPWSLPFGSPPDPDLCYSLPKAAAFYLRGGSGLLVSKLRGLLDRPHSWPSVEALTRLFQCLPCPVIQYVLQHWRDDAFFRGAVPERGEPRPAAPLPPPAPQLPRHPTHGGPQPGTPHVPAAGDGGRQHLPGGLRGAGRDPHGADPRTPHVRGRPHVPPAPAPRRATAAHRHPAVPAPRSRRPHLPARGPPRDVAPGQGLGARC
ncbi:hypothetical protein Q9966_016277 [Columba livia]|nr:hypothetical protein Q9966_016277 [Columba livia]